VGWGAVDAPRDWYVQVHRHDSYELLFIRSGTYEGQVNKTLVRAVAGEALLVRPNDVHEDTSPGPCQLWAVRFLVKGMSAQSRRLELLDPSASPSLLVVDGLGPALEAFQARVAAEDEAPNWLTPHVLDAATHLLFWEMMRRLPDSLILSSVKGSQEPHPLEERLHEVFMQNLGKNPSVEDIASELGMSVSSLERGYRKLGYGSVAKAFMRLKMDEGLELLRYTSRSIKEISDSLGFSNPSHFSTVFSRHFGRSPSAVRRSIDPTAPDLEFLPEVSDPEAM
jgi:AraC-like DNA-binding protein